jgi:hypothetical protein
VLPLVGSSLLPGESLASAFGASIVIRRAKRASGPQPRLGRRACTICGHPVFDAKNHDIAAARAAKMFPLMTCNCGKPGRVRCFNGVGTYWVECGSAD